MGNVLIIAEHIDGQLADHTFEMLATARGLAGQLGGSVTVGLIGGSDAMVAELGAADSVLKIGDASYANFNPESWTAAAKALIGHASPSAVLIGHTSMGMDMTGALGASLGIPTACSCTAIEAVDGIVATLNILGGKMNARVELGDGPCIAAMASGAAQAADGRVAGSPTVEDVAAPATAGQVRFLSLEQPEAADVDITAQEVLVAIGRGIGEEDGVEVAQELADALDAAVAGSRPIVDAGWLPKSRQVGKSGLKVTPKVYLALGISGAPEHLEGIKGVSTIIAVNTDPNAPIFRIAHYGLVADLYEVCEELTELAE